MAGREWVDFMDLSVDKGKALQVVENLLKISPNSTMAFGDNQNDCGMMAQASESYAVRNAVEETMLNAKYLCDEYTKLGVYHVIKKLMEE